MRKKRIIALICSGGHRQCNCGLVTPKTLLTHWEWCPCASACLCPDLHDSDIYRRGKDWGTDYAPE